MARTTVPLRWRYVFLLAELLVLFVANRLAFGSWLPSPNAQGLWFYAALFGLLLGQRLDTPFFTTPKDALLYAVPAAVAVLQIGQQAWANNALDGQGLKWLLLGWIGLTIVVSSLAILFQSDKLNAPAKISLVGTHLSGALGNPRTFFSVILVLLLVAFPPASTLGLLAIVVAWSLSVPFSLFDYLYGLVRRVRRALITGSPHIEAEVASFQVPGLIVLRAHSETSFPRGAIVAYRTPTREVRLASVLGHAGRDSGALTRAIDLGASQAQHSAHANAIEEMTAINAPAGLVSVAQNELAESYESTCVGVVAPESEIARLLVDVTTEQDLSAGRLVRARCGSSDAFYQLTNGLTKEDIVHQKNTFGFIAAHAKCVGRWNEAKSAFDSIDWIPSPNAPVWLVKPQEREHLDVSQVGTFPGTTFGVGFRNTHHLVTHNTAILGILGVGKSMLALELIERGLSEGCKVIALDLTDQYEEELAGLFDPAHNGSVVKALQDKGGGKATVSMNVEEGGAKLQFTKEVGQQVGFYPVNADTSK